MKNQLFSVGVKHENPTRTEHTFCVSLEFIAPIKENDAREWLQRIIADAADKQFEIDI